MLRRFDATLTCLPVAPCRRRPCCIISLPFRLSRARVLNFVLVLLLAGLFMIPFAMLWTRRDLETSFKGMLTLIGIVVAVALALVIVGENLIDLQNRVFGRALTLRTRRAHSGEAATELVSEL
jgi:hypothetical protein